MSVNSIPEDKELSLNSDQMIDNQINNKKND